MDVGSPQLGSSVWGQGSKPSVSFHLARVHDLEAQGQEEASHSDPQGGLESTQKVTVTEHGLGSPAPGTGVHGGPDPGLAAPQLCDLGQDPSPL